MHSGNLSQIVLPNMWLPVLIHVNKKLYYIIIANYTVEKTKLQWNIFSVIFYTWKLIKLMNFLYEFDSIPATGIIS